MSQTLSDHWYRVAALRPQLRNHARLHRQVVRGQAWYLLQDPGTQRTHRFRPAAKLLIGLMNGQRNVEQIWAAACRQLGEDAPTQDEVIALLGQLHQADLLRSDVMPDAAETVRRSERQASARQRQSWSNPLSLRIPLWDPDAALNRLAPVLNRVWGWPGALLWLGVVLSALAWLPTQGAALGQGLADQVLALDNLPWLLAMFVLVKLAHELGHAVAVKRGGGEVHDLGVMLLVLMPVPYVDAGASEVFRSRLERMMVGAAGMVAELFLAALALHLWVWLEPGLLRSLLFNVIVVAGLSTLLFNGNPLLRYDAYYMLVDAAQLPNLGTRANRWWGWWVMRHLFRVEDAVNPANSPAEQRWYALYGLAAWACRTAVSLSIALYLLDQYFFIGLLLSAWVVAGLVGRPLLLAWRTLAGHQLGARRGLARGLSLAVLAALVLLVGAVPAPQRTLAEGVVWLPDQAQLRAPDDAQVAEVLAVPGQAVRAGQPVLRLHDPALETRLAETRARVAELQAVYLARLPDDRAAAAQAQAPLNSERAQQASLQARTDALTLRAGVNGVFVLPRGQDWPGRRVRRGDLLAHVLEPGPPLVRVVVGQDVADRVVSATRAVTVRLAHAPGQAQAAEPVRSTPQANASLPHRALSVAGGGPFSTDPRDPDGLRALERLTQLDLRLPPDTEVAGIGERVWVRFEHPPAPLAVQGWQALQRLLLAHWAV